MRLGLLSSALVLMGSAAFGETACPGLAVCFTSINNTTQVTIEVSPEATFVAKRLSNPDRIFFDIEGANFDDAKSQTIPVGDGIVKQIRTAERPSSTTRVVFDLEKSAEFTADKVRNPDRLVIVLRPAGTAPTKASSIPAPKPRVEPESPTPRQAKTYAPLKPKPLPELPVSSPISREATIPPARIEPAKLSKPGGNGEVRFWSEDDLTRVSIEIQPTSKFTSKHLSDPERIFFDIENPKVPAKKLRTIPVGDPRVKQIRVASSRPDVTRVVFDLEQFSEFTTSKGSDPDHLVIELRAKSQRLPPFRTATATAASADRLKPDALNWQAESSASAKSEVSTPETKPLPEPVAPTEAANTPAPAPVSMGPAPPSSPSPSPAPVPAAPPADKKIHLSATSRVLKIVPLQGENGINNIKTNTFLDPVVEVRDDHDMPIPGADVTFQLPVGGPGGFFPGRSLSLTTKTNEQGQAQASGAIPNDVAGRFNIKVAATSEDRTGSVIISEINVHDMADASKIAKRRSKKWIIVGIAASAAITTGIILATHGGGSSASTTAPPNSISVTPGPITIGGPH